MDDLRSTDPHNALELMLLADPAVDEARVLDLAGDGRDAEWVVAVSFEDSRYKEPSQSSELVNGLKNSLTRRMESVYGNITLPTKWFLVNDFPVREDDSIDDEKLRLLVIREDSKEDSDAGSEKIADTPAPQISTRNLKPTNRDTASSSPFIQESIRKMIQFPHFTHPSITRPTILQAAWAMVVSRYLDTKDVSFSLASNMSERDFSASGMAARVTSTVPMQIRLNEQLPISTFLLQVKQNASRPATHRYGNQKQPSSRRGSTTPESDQLESLLIVRSDRHKDAPLSFEPEGQLLDGCDTYGLMLQATILGEHIDLVLAFNAACISEDTAISLIDSYDAAVHQLIKRLQAANWLYRVSWK